MPQRRKHSKKRLHTKTLEVYHSHMKYFTQMDANGIENRPTNGKMGQLMKTEFGG